MRQLKITKQVTNRETASLDKYLQEIGKVELITAEEEVQLAIKIKNGDKVPSGFVYSSENNSKWMTKKDLKNWLDKKHTHNKNDKDAWVKLFKKTFKFTGGEITGEFLMSTGFLSGAHRESCPVFIEIAKRNPPWMRGA